MLFAYKFAFICLSFLPTIHGEKIAVGLSLSLSPYLACFCVVEVDLVARALGRGSDLIRSCLAGINTKKHSVWTTNLTA